MSCSCARAVALWLLVGLLVETPASAEEADQPALPIRRIVLFTSGVAFVEHRGEVDGDQTIDFHFHVEDVNDLLKSLVVQDEGGGRIETVTYTPQAAPIDSGNLRIDPATVRSLGDLLSQLRGEKVSLEVNNKQVQGTVIGIDRRRVQNTDQQVSEQETLLLKSDAGIRNVLLANVVALKLLDETLDGELQQALEALAKPVTSEKKQVSLKLRGDGKRQVRVGYIQEFPVWKTSYRLVLGQEKPLLQGWAIVENTTQHDWSDVQVSLVSGRPVSFVMDLYQPLFLDRPRVVPELFAGLRPKIHEQDLAGAEQAFRRAAAGGGGFFGGGGLGGGGFGGGVGGGNRPFVTSVIPVLEPRSSIQVAAKGAEVGALFRYAIEHPVTLASQQSAMLPIVNDAVEVVRKVVFNAATHEKHPLAAVELKNTTKLHIMQGPLTLFDAGEYAGDAQIADLAPQTKRLVTYALDLNVEVAVTDAVESPEEVTEVQITDGRVTATKTHTRSVTYTVKNSHSVAREVLIEQEIDEDWKLLEPEPSAEQTRNVYRFSVAAQPGVPIKQDVVEERKVQQQIALAVRDSFGDGKSSAIDREGAYRLAQSVAVKTPALEAALAEWRVQHEGAEQTSQQLATAVARMQEIGQEQSRIRQNLAQLPEESEIYRSYLTTLAEQEEELKTLRSERTRLAEVSVMQQAELEAYLRNLKVE